MKLKIALVGYGKMGKMLAALALQHNCEVVSIIDPLWEGAHREINAQSVANADVCVDFTSPKVVVENISRLAALGKDMVIGTTGWESEKSKVQEIVESSGVGLVYGANFSIGMNLFFRIVEVAAQEIGKFADYDAYGVEYHHRQKVDSPSGTAKALAQILLDKVPSKEMPLYEMADRKIEEQELHFVSLRAGFIPGTHTVGFDSEADTIELCHRVRNRSCLAIGALKSVPWIHGKKGFYSFTQYIKEMVC